LIEISGMWRLHGVSDASICLTQTMEVQGAELFYSLVTAKIIASNHSDKGVFRSKKKISATVT